MYTGTIFNWHDNSGFETNTEVPDSVNRPLFMVVNSFDKGPEKLMEVDATTFNDLYGTMSFSRHGQGSIQAQNIINAGGRLLVKRVCASNSALANSVLVAKVTSEGKLSWTIKKIESVTVSTSSGTVTREPHSFAEIKKAAVDEFFNAEAQEYPLFVITDNGRGISNKAMRIIPDYDTARGLDKMIYRFYIYEGTTLTENVNISLDPTYIFNNEYYGLDKNRMTQVTGEVIPEIFDQFIEDISLKYVYKDVDEAKVTDDMKSVVAGYDLIFGLTQKGEEIYQLDETGAVVYSGNDAVVAIEIEKNEDGSVKEPLPEYDEETGKLIDIKYADLNTAYGNKFLFDGDNGDYGVSPAKYGIEHNVYDFYKGSDANIVTENINLPEEPTNAEIDRKAYQTLIRDIARVYFGKDTDGSDIDEIWDVDSHKIFAVADANYHKIIKDAMAVFVTFRKDCIFLRDSGIGFYDVKSAQDVYTNYTLDFVKYLKNPNFINIVEALGIDPKINQEIAELRSKFIVDYGTTYEVIDPGSKKHIEVTMIYDLVTPLVTQYITSGPFAPLAGTYNGFQLNSAIQGTVNFTPIITPSSNQKQAVDDIRLNYAIFEEEDICVVQSNYTSQDKNTQLSFANNVLAIQEVARVVRTACPRNRFSLITGSDMSEYATAVTRVLEGYNSYFETLEFQYTQDPLRSIQKIFYASINFSFNNWAQTEIFDLYALANTTTTSVNS